MKRLLLTGILLVLPLGAQQAAAQEKAPPPPRVQKLFVLKYADPRALESMLRVLGDAATVVSSTEMRALAITATEPAMKSIEEAIARLDTPAAAPKNIELTCYLLIGGDGGADAAAALPKDLDSVVTQLRNTFAFKNYRLMDVLNMRTRTGQRLENSSSGAIPMPGGSPPQPVLTQFRINSASIAPDGATIRLDGLRTSSRVPISTGAPGNFNWQELGINTDVDLKEGQKIVIGRVGLSQDQALFLVLMAKVVS
jgi:hypothetical protein